MNKEEMQELLEELMEFAFDCDITSWDEDLDYDKLEELDKSIKDGKIGLK